MNLERLFKNNEEWIGNKLDVEPDFFNNLSKGQHPELLYIGCSDSRVTAEEFLGLKPGEALVHRNIANMIISIDLNAMSVVNYAINHIGVNHVIVCGHYGCDGVKAAMEATDLGILNPWLRNIRDVYRLHSEELNAIVDEENRYNRLVELNVEEQCINLIKTATVQKAYNDRNLRVHGWVFDIHSGKLIDLEINFEEKLKNIMKIYNLLN